MDTFRVFSACVPIHSCAAGAIPRWTCVLAVSAQVGVDAEPYAGLGGRFQDEMDAGPQVGLPTWTSICDLDT